MPGAHDQESLRLVVAAAQAAGVAPAGASERGAWMAGVRSLAVDLYRLSHDLVPDLEQLAEATAITGVIVEVKDQSGRAVITIRPTMGTHEPDKLEDLRTPWLNEPKGAAMAAQARALIGVQCRFGKFVEAIDASKKVRMCLWLEPIGAAPASPSAPAPSPRPQAPAAPANGESRPAPPAAATPVPAAESAAPPQPPAPAPPPESTADVEAAAFAAELRGFKPASTAQVIDWARRSLGIGPDDVKATAAKVLEPLAEGAVRSRTECEKLWGALIDAWEPF
jgi:hypothetical protein